VRRFERHRIDFFGLFKADITDLSVGVNKAGTELKLQGKVKTESPVRGQAIDTVTLDLAGENYIAVTDQPPPEGVQVKGELKLDTNWDLGKGWALEDVTLKLDTEAARSAAAPPSASR
jgi:hypothetical protein